MRLAYADPPYLGCGRRLYPEALAPVRIPVTVYYDEGVVVENAEIDGSN